MSSLAFGALIEHESSHSPGLAPPAAVAQKPTSDTGLGPTEVELDKLQWGQKLNGPSGHSQAQTASTSERESQATPGELEQSNPATPRTVHAVDPIMSASNPPMNRWRLGANFLMVFTQGINDSAPGALIPYMERDYNIGYAIVSLIFISNAVGYITAAPLVQVIENRFGRARTYMFAESLVAMGYIAIICKPPFPVVVVTFFLLGFGMAINLALNNVFCANLLKGAVILGLMHGSYGLGGTVAPLMATAMVSKGIQWSYFYLIPLVLVLIGIGFAGWSFWDYENDTPVQLLTALERTVSRRAVEACELTRAQLLKRAVKNSTTLLGALFIFAYQGAEVSISGWVISFLINYRNGDPSQVGYVTAGFWAGITLGRFLLVQPATKIGERITVYGLTIGAAVFQLLVWLVPNVIGNAVAVSLIGLLLGPVYPCATIIFSRLLTRNIQMSSLSFIASMGSSGGAMAPFFTGLLAQRLGTVVLHPICIGLYVLMEVSWALLPKIVKRSE
jgi:fucose permease